MKLGQHSKLNKKKRVEFSTNEGRKEFETCSRGKGHLGL